mgnify:CR=1 FL=1
MIDALITALIIGSAFNGMRRGFIREALVFALWVPIYVVSVILVINTYKPAGDAQNASAVHDILMLLGFIFMVGSVFIFVLNKSIIQPWMQKRRLHSTQTIDTFLGFILGGARFLVILFITVMIYDIFFSPFKLTGIPDSTYIEEAYKQSVPVKRWLIEEGYIDIEIILYDKEFEDKENKKNDFMKDLEGITGGLR